MTIYKVEYGSTLHYATKIDGVEILGLTKRSLFIAVRAYKDIRKKK